MPFLHRIQYFHTCSPPPAVSFYELPGRIPICSSSAPFVFPPGSVPLPVTCVSSDAFIHRTTKHRRCFPHRYPPPPPHHCSSHSGFISLTLRRKQTISLLSFFGEERVAYSYLFMVSVRQQTHRCFLYQHMLPMRGGGQSVFPHTHIKQENIILLWQPRDTFIYQKHWWLMKTKQVAWLTGGGGSGGRERWGGGVSVAFIFSSTH